jgi:ubiquinone/menaquinone biosynthesis C-methylase UbiE
VKKSTPNNAVEIQRHYYSETASCYDSMHAHEGVMDASTIGFVHAILRMIDARSILDVGTATGRGLHEMRAALPDAFVCGAEPVRALIQQGMKPGQASGNCMVCASGDALPFPDGSFDAVCEFAVLHHAANPKAVVREMMRVAKKAVILCDSNRFGQGAFPARLLKLALYKCGLWPAFNYVRTGGKGYIMTEGDGLSYSYSVYDSLDLFGNWASRTILVPTDPVKTTTWFSPLLSSAGVLLCALKS